MSRFIKQAQLGWRWVQCGWRLFRRSPGLLFAMGLYLAVLVGGLAMVSFVGLPLIGIVAPALLAGFYRTLDRIAHQQKRVGSKGPGFALFKQSALELTALFKDENRLIQMTLLGVGILGIVVAGGVVTWTVAGTGWLTQTGFSLSTLLRLLIAAVVAFSFYAAIGGILVYGLPLMVFQQEPLAPALARSAQVSLRHPGAVVILFVLMLAPFLLGALTGAWFSRAAGLLVSVLAGAVTLPVAIAGLYCSYRTIFPSSRPAQVPAAALRVARPSPGR